MAGLTKSYIESNLIAQLALLQRRLGDVERGLTLEGTALPTILYEETTNEPYYLILRIEEGRGRLFARPISSESRSTGVELLIS